MFVDGRLLLVIVVVVPSVVVIVVPVFGVVPFVVNCSNVVAVVVVPVVCTPPFVVLPFVEFVDGVVLFSLSLVKTLAPRGGFVANLAVASRGGSVLVGA